MSARLDPAGLAAAVRAGDRRAGARLLTLAESGDPAARPALQDLYRSGGAASIVGVTGPPGAGKSTTVDQLVSLLRGRGQSVAVVAVDPSSPFSGGAVLGDRVRMNRHADDPGVLIRSMAARGALGGLAPAVGDALTILDAMGFDSVIIETVGVGQSEVDILNHADVVVLLQTAFGGDGVQMVKAGILEIADILAVNKADLADAERTVKGLRETVAHAAPRADEWSPPVIPTVATSNEGVQALADAIDAFQDHRTAHREADRARRLKQARSRVLALSQARLRRTVAATSQALETALEEMISRRADPYEIADRLFTGDL